MDILIVFFYIGVPIIIYYCACKLKKVKKQEEQIEKEKTIRKKRKFYDDYSKRYDILLEEYKKSKYYFCDKIAHYAILNKQLLIMAVKEDISYISIEDMKKEISQVKYNIDYIKYYKLEESVYQLQHITGDGNSDSRVKEAIVDGLIAEDVGTIIGSRKKINDIQTFYTTKDDQRLEITFKDDTVSSISYQYYDRLLDYMSEKNYDNYIITKKYKGRMVEKNRR